MIAGALFLLAQAAVVHGGAPPEFPSALAEARSGHCDGAADELAAYIQKQQPSSAEPYRVLALCRQQAGKLQESIATLRQGLAAVPAAPLLQRLLGELLFHEDPNSSESGALLESAASSLPNDAESRHYFAQWAYVHNREQVCADQETAALKLKGLNEAALLQMHTLLAFCENKLGHLEEAQSSFGSAYAIDLRQPSFDPAMAYQYVDFLSKNGNEREAEELAAEILKRAPHFGPAHLMRAKYFSHRKETESAISEAQLVLTGEGNDNQTVRAAHLLLARSYFALGDMEKSKVEQDWIKEQAGSP